MFRDVLNRKEAFGDNDSFNNNNNNNNNTNNNNDVVVISDFVERG